MPLLQHLKRLLAPRRREPELQEDLDGSLRGHALRRATHREKPKTGTPHDWEDWDAYQTSLARLEAKMRGREEEE